MTTVTLRYFDGCPNWKVALARLHEAIDGVGVDHVQIEVERVETPERAQELRFRGSPTILMNGTDPFDDDDDQRLVPGERQGCHNPEHDVIG